MKKKKEEAVNKYIRFQMMVNEYYFNNNQHLLSLILVFIFARYGKFY